MKIRNTKAKVVKRVIGAGEEPVDGIIIDTSTPNLYQQQGQVQICLSIMRRRGVSSQSTASNLGYFKKKGVGIFS